MSNFYYPEKIIDSVYEDNQLYYHVKWKGYKQTTWEPEKHIAHRTDLIQEYRDMTMIENMTLNNGGYIYCRVSSKEQSKYNEGHTSLEVQEEKIRNHCAENDIEIIECVREIYSARNMGKMKGLQYLLDIVPSGRTIFVYDISRFSRNIQHALNILDTLSKKNINVYSVSENINYNTPSGKNQFRLQLCSSTYFSDMLSQKINASISYRSKRGDYIGGTAFGFKTEVDEKTNIRTKVENKEEMDIIEKIRERKDKSEEEILKYLKKNNITFRKRAPTVSGIKRILKRFNNDLRPSLSYGKIKRQRKRHGNK